MEEKGHIILITARDKEITLDLLSKYNFHYIPIGGQKPGRFNLIKEWAFRDIQLFWIGRAFHPDVLLGIGNPSVAHTAKLLGKKSIIFTDTEHAKFANGITFPFADTICTPSCFNFDISPKQIHYNGYHELAYLHPNRFTPNPAVLDELGLSEGDPFIIVRFVSWEASHDLGNRGLAIETKRNAIREFEKYGRVFITSEKHLPSEFEKYRISTSPEKMHDLLYYATLIYGESATMASECAVLGTHAIFCDFAGRGYTDEEEKDYGLVFNYGLDSASQEMSIKKAVELLDDPDLRNKGQEKRERLLNDKIDVTAFMVWFIENYPGSVDKMKTNPELQNILEFK
jgi:predicted glycosyltransferase